MTFLILLSLFFSTNSWGRSLKATADKLGSDMINLGLAVGTFAIVVAGIWLMLGKQDAGVKLTQSVTGILVIACVMSIKSFIVGVA
ncbi:MAG: hypothetical protein WDA09_00305 [Bacteriovoracaceae bacterium]